jgi:hypothetical protein
MNYTKSLLLVLLVALLGSFPIWQYIKVAERIEGFVSDVGMVIGHVEKKSNSISARGATVYSFSSVISYQGMNGEAKNFTSIISRSPATPLGSKVYILVEPIDRKIAYEAGLFGIWLGVTVSVGISLGLGLFVAFVIYLKTKSKTSSNEKA